MATFTPPLVRAQDGRLLDSIEIRALHVNCIVGAYPGERKVPQPLEVDLALHLDTRKAGHGGGFRHTVDYARTSGELRFLLESGQFVLLETAAEALASYLLAPATSDVPRAEVEAVTLRLEKPRALGEAVPSVTVHRTLADRHVSVEDRPFGKVDVVYQGGGCGIYRLRIAPGSSIPAHMHRVLHESELILGDELHLQGRPVQAGMAFCWPRGMAHRYDNPSAMEQTVLCVDRPEFLESDEIAVDDPLPPVSGVSYYPEDSR